MSDYTTVQLALPHALAGLGATRRYDIVPENGGSKR